MLSIFATTKQINSIHQIINSENRLSELVNVFDSKQHLPTQSGNSLIIDERGILPVIDWHNTAPPYLLSNPLPFEKEVLLGLIFSKLGNDEKAWNYLQNYPLLQFDIGILKRLQLGIEIDKNEFTSILPMIDQQNDFEQYRIQHNTAVLQHYGFSNQAIEIEALQNLYKQALELAPNIEYKAFTAKHFAYFLVDAKEINLAEKIISEQISEVISEEAVYALKAVLTNIWMQKLTVPYDEKLLEKLKNTLWEVLQFLEKNNRNAEAALLLVDATHIANISKSFSEALGYITKAIRIFEAEELEELAGNAHLQKGTLLFTWAQDDNPQFFKAALDAYQQALKVFTKELAPNIFASIHHQLGNIYVDMPAEKKKKSIWAGVANSSFQEALDFYTKEQYPYEYGMICNNFGNAFTKFPQAVLTDNFEKALFYYQEALDVRSPKYPYERAITLLNFLEASWNVGNNPDEFNQERFDDMLAKANEIKNLVDDKEMLAEAERHLELLKELQTA